MANLATSEDCLDFMYYRAGEDLNNAQFGANALLYLNVAHREFVSGTTKIFPDYTVTWPWAKSAQPKTLTLVPSESGTATVTQNSTGFTFSVAPATSRVGWHIRFGSSDSTTYRIETHTGGSSAATLDSEVAVTSGSVSYVLFKIDYTLGASDVLRFTDSFTGFVDPSNGGTDFRVIAEDEAQFRRAFSRPSEGSPTHFTVLRESAGTWTLRFSHYLAASTYQRLEAPYIPIPSDLSDSSMSVPLVPLQHRQHLCNLALYYLYLDKNDARAPDALPLAQAGYLSMLRELGVKDVTQRPVLLNQAAKVDATNFGRG